MKKTFSPNEVEQTLYSTWEKNGYFAAKDASTQQPSDAFSLMIPPPNITGSLHMGHAFQDTIMDVLVRYHRMKGCSTLWQMGTDHAGIATQMVVERQLAAEGITRQTLGRDQFIDKIWQWKESSGGTIAQQLRRLGASVDWSRERFTMDEGLSKAVQTVFIQLYQEDLIYRGNRLVNWDPKFHTAISDLEVVSEEEQGSLWHFNYPINGTTGQYLTVATTRPETMLGDTAVAVHPDDERYQDLIGQTIRLPLTDREIPIIADTYVDREFGTGCVKITPAHDFNDYEMGKRHDLPMINIFTKDAALNDNCPEPYQGMDRYDARKRIIEDLQAQGLLEKIEAHTLKVPKGDRSGVAIEPFLTEQWYVKTAPLAEPAIKAVEEGHIQFVPKNWENTYFAWMRDIQDWCISRQLWWGHRIPAWYDEAGNIYVGESEEQIRKKHQLSETLTLTQDEDVLDTWFSSALWTFSTLGWPEKTAELARYHPTSVLVTGFDIIFFWVARMIMMSLKFTGDIPFKTVYVHGLVRDAEGQKMSKSKGNVLDPIDLIDGIELETLVNKRTSGLMQPQQATQIESATRKHFPEGIAAYGTDSLRFTFCSLASTGRDIRFDVGRIEGYRNFCNKIWNASRYVLLNCVNSDTGETLDCHSTLPLSEHHIVDRWITARFQETIQAVDEAIARYRFDIAAQQLNEFIRHEYCDWYLELSKPILYGNGTDEEKTATRSTLLNILEQTLRLTHAFMPFITETIWLNLKPLLNLTGDTIMTQPLPEINKDVIDTVVIEDIQWLKEVVTAIRNIRGEIGIAPSKAITIYLHKGSSDDKNKLQKLKHLIIKLTNCAEMSWHEKTTEPPVCATQLVGDMEILIPMAGLVDPKTELMRLDKTISKLQGEIKRLTGKLKNSKFINNAPSEVVENERKKRTEAESALTIHLAQQQKFQQLDKESSND